MRRRAGTLLILVAGATSLACGQRPGAETASDLQRASLGEPATAALVVGCWLLAWEVPGTTGGALGQLPDSVRLRDEAVFGTRERLVAPATYPDGRSGGGSGMLPWERNYVLNRWWIEDDALQLRFSDGGRTEWDVTLGLDTDQLVGSARYESDPRPPGGPVQAGVQATRIPCEF